MTDEKQQTIKGTAPKPSGFSWGAFAKAAVKTASIKSPRDLASGGSSSMRVLSILAAVAALAVSAAPASAGTSNTKASPGQFTVDMGTVERAKALHATNGIAGTVSPPSPGSTWGLTTTHAEGAST